MSPYSELKKVCSEKPYIMILSRAVVKNNPRVYLSVT